MGLFESLHTLQVKDQVLVELSLSTLRGPQLDPQIVYQVHSGTALGRCGSLGLVCIVEWPTEPKGKGMGKYSCAS